MATVSRHFCRCALSLSKRVPLKRKCAELPRYRHFSTTRRFQARDEDADEDEGEASSGGREEPQTMTFSPDILGKEGKEFFEKLSIAEQNTIRQKWLGASEEISNIFNAFDRDPALRGFGDDINNTKVSRSELGYWADEEDDEHALVPDGDDGPEGDMTSIAHEELILHREIREYARLAAWDMPFLSSGF